MRLQLRLPPAERMEEVWPLLEMVLSLADLVAEELQPSSQALAETRSLRRKLQEQQRNTQEEQEKRDAEAEARRLEKLRRREEEYAGLSREAKQKWDEKEEKKKMRKQMGKRKVRRMEARASVRSPRARTQSPSRSADARHDGVSACMEVARGSGKEGMCSNSLSERAAQKRTSGATKFFCRSMLCPNSSRMLLTPNLIMVGLQRAMQITSASELAGGVAGAHAPLQRQAASNDLDVLGQPHGQQHLGTENTRVANLGPLAQVGVEAKDLHGGLCVGVVGGLEAELGDACAVGRSRDGEAGVCSVGEGGAHQSWQRRSAASRSGGPGSNHGRPQRTPLGGTQPGAWHPASRCGTRGRWRSTSWA